MPAAPVRGSARRLWGYLRPLRPLLALGLGCLVLQAALQPTLLALVSSWSTRRDLAHIGIGQVHVLFAQITVLGLTVAVAEFGNLYISDYLGQAVTRDLRRDLFAHLQSLSLSFYDDQSTGTLMSRALNDINVVQSRFSFELARLVGNPVSIAGCVWFMLWKSPRLTLVSVLVIGVLVPIMGRFTRLLRKHSSALQDRLGDLSARMQESLAAIRVVQCFGAGGIETARFDQENAEVRRAAMRTVRVRAFLQPLTHVIGLLGVLVVLWVGAIMAYGPHPTVSILDVLLMIGAMQFITTNAKQVGRSRMLLAELLNAADKIFQVIDTPSDVVDRPGARELVVSDGRVTFEQVSFTYRTGRQVLDGVSLELAPGEAVAVVGESGSGKSTLANMIPRLYDVSAGRVLVDGHDVRDVTLDSLRRTIGIVPQETVLFRGTIADNIAYGRPSATPDEIAAAAEAANAAGFIREFPEGYATKVGERGRTLSGGQAQRVAIARALLRDPRILILDEATSSLDTANEAVVQEALERLMHSRTTLVIAHRLSTVKNCDRIVVLREGRIAEQGTFAELQASDGVFRRMWRTQVGDNGA